VIVATAEPSPAARSRVLRHPLLAYLPKPMNDSVLLAAIRSLQRGAHHA